MKKLMLITLVVPLLVTASENVAPKLSKLSVLKVETRGEVLSENRHHPYTTYLLGIPAVISLPSVCTEFVGQTTEKVAKAMIKIDAVGSSNPLEPICIAILAEPVKTTLTYEMEVLTGGFVPAYGDHTKSVLIDGKVYAVTLNVDNNTVTIKPASNL